MNKTHERNLNVAGFILAIVFIVGFFTIVGKADADRHNTWKVKVSKVTQGVPQK
jgi:hypothetical protein